MIAISFSGMDGAGKSTQCRNLVQRLRMLGAKVRFIHLLSEGQTIGSTSQAVSSIARLNHKLRTLPGEGFYGIVRLFAGLIYFLMDAWMTFIMHRIRYNNSIVVYDRFFFDTLVIFAAKFPVVPWWVLHVARLLPRCSVTFIMEVAPKIAMERRPEESGKTLNRYFRLYKRLSDILGVNIINSSVPKNAIRHMIENRCQPVFKLFN